MKKYLVYSLFGAAALTMASCDEDFNDVAAPQEWAQEEAITLPGLTISPVATVDLAQAGDSVAIFSHSLSAALPENTTLDNFRVDLVAESGSATLNASTNGKVLTSELQSTIEELYGKRPTEREFAATIYANIMMNGQASLLKGETTVKAIPVAPIIEEAYYLVGAPNGWAWNNGDYKFAHSDKDVYEDPIFTITFAAPTDEDGNRIDCWFKINPKSAFESGEETSATLGCEINGSTELEGTLIAKGETTCGAINMPASDGAKFYKVTLNMMDYTYKVELLNFQEFIYVPGEHQGWTPATAQALQSPNFDGVYTGFCYLNGNFKFTKERNWDNGEYNFNDFTTKDDIFFNNDGSNINISEAGFYMITADVAASKLSAVKTSWGIIGDATANGWDADQDMTWSAEKGCWTTEITLKDGTFKFRANDGWDINFGGDPANLSAGGDNIPATAGTYVIDLFLERATTNNIYCVITKK